MDAAREQEVVGLQPSELDPLLYGVTGSGRDLKLNRSLGLVLHHDSSRGNLVAVADVAHLQRDEVASAKLAVDAQVEEREFADPVLHLKTNPKRPDVLQLEGGLLPDDLALVPRLAMSGVACGSHDGLPSS